MSILGVVVRTRLEDAAQVASRLAALPGADLALPPSDGRMVLVLEDAERDGVAVSAASNLSDIATWPDVLNTSLVYEYSGPDSPAPESAAGMDYRAWRGRLDGRST